MSDLYSFAAQSSLFKDIPTDVLPQLFESLEPYQKTFAKEQIVIHENAPVQAIGIFTSGKVIIEQEDFFGNTAILAQISPGDLFAEAYACGQVKKLPVLVKAREDSNILFFDFHRLINYDKTQTVAHDQLIKNLLGILAMKNIYLVQKMSFVTKRTIREKVLAYLSNEAKKSHQNPFKIPFKRQELADFLAIDRSALSKELALMQKEGLIQFHKNIFWLNA